MIARGVLLSSAMFASLLFPSLASAQALPATSPPPSPTISTVGGTTILLQSDDHSSLAGAELIVRAGLDRETLKQNGLAALAAQTILDTPVAMGAGTTMPLQQAVAANGGSVTYTVDPSDVRFYVEALSADATPVLAMVRGALAAPSFDAATVRMARGELVAQIAQSQRLALQVGIDMLNAASAMQANTGLPSRGTPASLAQFLPSDVHAFYSAYYRRGGAFVSAAGRLGAVDSSALGGLALALAPGSSLPVNVHVAELKGASREIVTHRDVASPWLIAQYPAPSVASKDYGPMLVLSAFVKRTLADIVQVPGVISPTFASDAVGAEYSYDRGPAHLMLYVNGGIGNPTRAFATALSVINILAATRLQGSIEEFKAVAAGDFAIDATKLEKRAWLAAVFSDGGSASPDFLARTLRAIAATTPADVQRVARRYLGNPTIALVLPRDESLGN